MSFSQDQIRNSFGVLFITVSIAVFFGAVLSEIVFLNKLSFYFYPVVWIASFATVFGITIRRFKKSIVMIRNRMKNSISWNPKIKAINGISWAVPFLLIGVFPSITQFLILLGIGLGNLTTYMFMKKFSSQNNKEQLIVAVLSLLSIPIAVFVDSSLVVSQDLAIMISRILISISYGVGGVYALKTSKNN